jgi:hypothetical protein
MVKHNFKLIINQKTVQFIFKITRHNPDSNLSRRAVAEQPQEEWVRKKKGGDEIGWEGCD